MTKKAIVAVSFGTSYPETRKKSIEKLEADFQSQYPEYQVRRAFTSRMIIKILKERDGIRIDTEEEAVRRLSEEGYTHIVLQPTHMIQGFEYDKIVSAAQKYKSYFQSLKLGLPLFSHPDDYQKTAQVLHQEFQPYETPETAIVHMGHGSGHQANASYELLQKAIDYQSTANHIIGTVEGTPDLSSVLSKLSRHPIRKVILTPLMIVAGDHAIQDMAGARKDSWNTILKSKGYQTECILKGLGESQGIRNIFLHHLAQTISSQ